MAAARRHGAARRRRRRAARRAPLPGDPAPRRRLRRGAFDIPAGFDADAQAPQGAADPGRARTRDKDLKDFSVYVFDDMQQTWQEVVPAAGQAVRERQARALLGRVDTACGSATSAVGPFYCPADQRVYLDLSFYRDMTRPARGVRRLRLGLRDRPRDGPPRPAAARHERRGRPARSSTTPTRPTRCPSGSSSRPTATPASGRTACSRALDAGDIDEAITRPRPSATTGSSARPGGRSTPTRSRTAPPSNVAAGSRTAAATAIPARATRSRRRTSKRRPAAATPPARAAAAWRRPRPRSR